MRWCIDILTSAFVFDIKLFDVSCLSQALFTLHVISLSLSHEEASLALKSKIIGLFLGIALWCIDQPLSDFLSVQKLCKQYLQCVFYTPLESLHYFIENVVSVKCSSQMKFCLLLPLDKTPVWGLVTVTSGGGYAHFNIPVWCRYWDSLFKFYSSNATHPSESPSSQLSAIVGQQWGQDSSEPQGQKSFPHDFHTWRD